MRHIHLTAADDALERFERKPVLGVLRLSPDLECPGVQSVVFNLVIVHHDGADHLSFFCTTIFFCVFMSQIYQRTMTDYVNK
jgi:hypothetical protein